MTCNYILSHTPAQIAQTHSEADILAELRRMPFTVDEAADLFGSNDPADPADELPNLELAEECLTQWYDNMLDDDGNPTPRPCTAEVLAVTWTLYSAWYLAQNHAEDTPRPEQPDDIIAEAINKYHYLDRNLFGRPENMDVIVPALTQYFWDWVHQHPSDAYADYRLTADFAFGGFMYRYLEGGEMFAAVPRPVFVVAHRYFPAEEPDEYLPMLAIGATVTDYDDGLDMLNWRCMRGEQETLEDYYADLAEYGDKVPPCAIARYRLVGGDLDPHMRITRIDDAEL